MRTPLQLNIDTHPQDPRLAGRLQVGVDTHVLLVDDSNTGIAQKHHSTA